MWLGINVDTFDIVFDNYLFSYFAKEFKNKDVLEIKNIYQEISKPACITYLHKEEMAILETSLKNKILKKDIEKVYKNFWWTSLGWENVKTKSYKYFEKLIYKSAQDKKSKEKLEKLNNHISSTLKKRIELIKKYKISSKTKHLLDVVDKYTYLHDLRKEMQVKNVYTLHLLLQEFSNRMGISVNNLKWYWPKEIIDLLKKQVVDKNILKGRQKNTCIILEKKLLKVYYGDKGMKKRKQELFINTDKVNIIKGQVANTGNATGIAKVCNGAKDALKKIKKGDILITGMTLPDYVPAMKRAGAIITDEGGITCHAAIMSRELDIPCIIGTKVASHILKDGDKIKVDAKRGVVEIIK
jgi:phosphoenolpyruvate synthase/pyruvate phosphate dikinase